jgi:hypothetical protein
VIEWVPCKRRRFIQRLRSLGFVGPFSGARHQYLVHNQCRLAVPSNQEYSVPQLRALIREVEEIIGRTIGADEWNSL